MASSHPFIVFFNGFAFLLLCTSAFIQFSYVAGEISSDFRHIVKVSSLLPGSVCLSKQDSSGRRLKLVHQDGACSPMKHSKDPNHTQILAQDQAHVNLIHQNHRRSLITTFNLNNSTQISPITSTATTIPAHKGKSFSTLKYIVTIGIGTPKNDYTVVFDTASDVTWIQCQPCVAYCYAQQEPIFDPTQSSTYSNVSCSEPACLQLDEFNCLDTTCIYSVRYGDNSYTVGFFAKDTLTLSSSDVITNFFFGCGEKNEGRFGEVAGILGLGRGRFSLISQSITKYNGVFSYCLPSTSSSAGYLTLGDGGAPANLNYTPMLTDSSSPSFYFLSLQSITVDGTKLSISPTVFSDAGTIIDSGTVISRLPPAAYSSLREAFREKMAKYPAAPAFSILDTCYDLSNYDIVDIPAVALEFDGGVVLEIDLSGTVYVANFSQVCMAFAGNYYAGDPGIFGNFQQRKFTVAYDVGKEVIGFGNGGCD